MRTTFESYSHNLKVICYRKTSNELPPLRPVLLWVRPSSSSPSLKTSGLELVEQVRELTNGSDLDAVIVPVGGGGLIGGVTTAVKAMCPGIRVIGAEPEEADDAYRSKLTGEVSVANTVHWILVPRLDP